MCLGCPPPDPFDTPMAEALPLANQPHLLQPNARREDLFGIPKQPVTLTTAGTSGDDETGSILLIYIFLYIGTNSGNPLENLPTKLSLSTRTADYAMNNPAKANQPISNALNVMGPNPLIYPQSYQPEDDSNSRSNYRDSQQQTDQQSGASSVYDSGMEGSGSSTNRPEVKPNRGKHFDRLLASMNENNGKKTFAL